MYAEYTADMLPTWLPAHLAFAKVTGLFYVIAGAAIVFTILPRVVVTLVAIMMSLFGLLIWVPSFFADPKAAWANPAKNEWSELTVNLVLASAAWMVAASFRRNRWGMLAVSEPPQSL